MSRRSSRYEGRHRKCPDVPWYLSAGALGVIAVLLAAAIALILVFTDSGTSGDDGISRSTVDRTALEPYSDFRKDCWSDELGWLSDPVGLNSGMQAFYANTGVQPALALACNINGDTDPDDAAVEAYASKLYDGLIGHEQGVLLLFCEWAPSDYDTYYMCGADAQGVMDGEACQVLLDYVRTYYTSDMAEDEYFATVFRDTADRIMSVTPGSGSRTAAVAGILIISGAGIAAIVLAAAWFRRGKGRWQSGRSRI